MPTNELTYVILKIESYLGDETYLSCGRVADYRSPFDEFEDDSHLYAVVAINKANQAEIVDCGYSTLEEAAEYWPQARPLPVSNELG